MSDKDGLYPNSPVKKSLFEKQKRCCSSCDAKRKCHICGDMTEWACSDCTICFGTTVYVCTKTKCRDDHEQAAIDHGRIAEREHIAKSLR